MLTPIGVLGGLRGVFFANIGGAGFNGQPLQGVREALRPTSADRLRGDRLRPNGAVVTTADAVIGRRPSLVDGRASYGIGLESFLLGFPMHFDWSWKTLFNRD